MKFKQLNGFVFDSGSGVLGAVAGVDFIKQTITIQGDNDEMTVAQLENVEFLEEVGAIGKVGVINRDVVQTADGVMYEIVLVDEKDVQLYLIDKKLQRVEAGDVISRFDLHALAPYVTVLGNIHELEPEALVDFNIVIVRDMADGEFQGYHYACNNADEEEVDLIKVVFIGTRLLEEKYERTTITHEQYLDLVENGSLKEVSPNELQNYITGSTSFYTPTDDVQDYENEGFEEEEIEEEEDTDEDYCDECGEHIEDCNCF